MSKLFNCHCGAAHGWAVAHEGGLLTADGVTHQLERCTFAGGYELLQVSEVLVVKGEGLTGASAVAAMDKAGRSQLRALVNNRVPSHLLGAEIASVKAFMLDTAIEVEVVGDTKGAYVVSEKELNDAGLTVAKAVALWR